MEEEEEERGPLLSVFLVGEAEEEVEVDLLTGEEGSPRVKSSSLLSTVEPPLFLEEDRGLDTILLKSPPLALGVSLEDFKEEVEGDLWRLLEGDSLPSLRV